MIGRLALDRDAIRGVLTAERVLEHYHVEWRGTRTLRLRECPRCKRAQRRTAVKVDRDTCLWCHHSGVSATCKGDAFDLIAAFEGLDAKRDFPRVFEIAAQIAGISPDTDRAEIEHRRAEYRAKREAYERRAAEERTRGEASVPGIWQQCTVRHHHGERYLAERGLDLAAIRARGDVLRFWNDGSPAVLLHSLDDGRPINIVRRLIRPMDDGTKILSLDLGRVLGIEEVTGSLSTLGSLVGRVGDIDPRGPDVAVLVEGVADTLAAQLAFPTCAVFGANGWRRMPDVAAAIVPRLVGANGWLLVTVDDDDQGVAGSGQAIRVALDAGLRIDRSLHVLDLDGHHDLADAWRAGWRWKWPALPYLVGGAA